MLGWLYFTHAPDLMMCLNGIFGYHSQFEVHRRLDILQLSRFFDVTRQSHKLWWQPKSTPDDFCHHLKIISLHFQIRYVTVALHARYQVMIEHILSLKAISPEETGN